MTLDFKNKTIIDYCLVYIGSRVSKHRIFNHLNDLGNASVFSPTAGIIFEIERPFLYSIEPYGMGRFLCRKESLLAITNGVYIFISDTGRVTQ